MEKTLEVKNIPATMQHDKHLSRQNVGPFFGAALFKG